MPSTIQASNKCCLVLHDLSNEWNYQRRLISQQLNQATHHSWAHLARHGQHGCMDWPSPLQNDQGEMWQASWGRIRSVNKMKTELLANKINSLTSDWYQLEHPSRSSLSALGTNQWLLSDILAQWQRTDEKNHLIVVVSALSAAQTSISYALIVSKISCEYSLLSPLIRRGNEGTSPTEIWKVFWDNATKFEREFQSW